MKNDINYDVNSIKRRKKQKRIIKKIKIVTFLVVILLIGAFAGIKYFNKEKEVAKEKNQVSNTFTTNNSTTSKENEQASKNGTDSKDDKKENNKDEKIVMTVDDIWNKKDGEKIAFLTFDDGPSPHTPKILDILEQYKIKATFFVLGTSAKNFPEYLKKEVELGHSIGNHTYNHKIRYSGAYTPDEFVKDVRRCDNAIKEVLGQDFKTNLVRFPGGSFNHKSYERNLLASGFKHIDWNVENGDARRLNVPKDELVKNVKDEIGNHKHVVILMHDSSTKSTTVEALPEIIEFLKSQGFKFGVVSQEN
ncbi:polysaccharide deacetylase family protein [Clostridium rectalis]|uniref:polysaccharide deacetylase family protein n=1 Tax=Clostridium rectalis TaxID=2040295 RepID=UPI000F63AD4C|nr:polysaccharide deacetylase family protein [Clostridium rectalis]